MTLHEAASKGYQSAADVYESGRPDYPRQVVEHFSKVFSLSKYAKVVDLAAGTGKLTRVLRDTLPASSSVLAIEPIEAMRSNLKRLVASVEVLGGVAELLPLRDDSVDAITVAQAFHWFQGDAALSEIHRVLKDGGGLGLAWNVRDSSIPWVLEVNKIIDRYEGGEGRVPRYKRGEWKEAFKRKPEFFTDLRETTFHSIQRGDRKTMLDRFLSISYIASLPPNEKQQFWREVDEILTKIPEKIIELPHNVTVYTCFKKRV